MSLKKIENKLYLFFTLSNPLTYCYIVGHVFGALFKEANNSLISFVEGMRR